MSNKPSNNCRNFSQNCNVLIHVVPGISSYKWTSLKMTHNIQKRKNTLEGIQVHVHVHVIILRLLVTYSIMHLYTCILQTDGVGGLYEKIFGFESKTELSPVASNYRWSYFLDNIFSEIEYLIWGCGQTSHLQCPPAGCMTLTLRSVLFAPNSII